MEHVKDKKTLFMILVSLFHRRKRVSLFSNSHLNTMHLVLIVSRSRSMTERFISINGMQTMFACHVHQIIFLWVEIIHIFSSYYFLLIKRNRHPMWPMIREWLHYLQQKCDNKTASIEDLKVVIFDLYFNLNKWYIMTEDDWKLCWTWFWYVLSWATH
jgi:hypothetical protein